MVFKFIIFSQKNLNSDFFILELSSQMKVIFTARKQSCGKVMFSQPCVSHSAKGGGVHRLKLHASGEWEGNVFTTMCKSFCQGGWGSQIKVTCIWRVHLQGDLHRGGGLPTAIRSQ